MRKKGIIIFIMFWILAGIKVFQNNLEEKEEQITQVVRQNISEK